MKEKKKYKHTKYKHKCKVCGIDFVSYNPIATYCSSKCTYSDQDWREKQSKTKKEHPISYWLGKHRDVSKIPGFDITGTIPWNKGTKCPQFSGVNHPNWKGKNSKEHICEYCKNPFETKRYNQQRFCSIDCKNKYIKDSGINSGENSATWQGGKSLECHSFQFKEHISKMIRERDKCCLFCKSEFNLIVHHIDCNKHNDNLDNLITLCRSCHSKYHNQRRKNGNKKQFT